jgi:hypothetical protein
MKRVLAYLVLFAAAAAAGASSCGQYESCDPGQTLVSNVCFSSSDGGGTPPTGDAAGSCVLREIPDGGDPMCTDKASGFGDNCTLDSHCRCATELCGIQAGQACGFCTRRGCLQDPSICPPGWSCFDATAFQAGFSLCVKF